MSYRDHTDPDDYPMLTLQQQQQQQQQRPNIPAVRGRFVDERAKDPVESIARLQMQLHLMCVAMAMISFCFLALVLPSLIISIQVKNEGGPAGPRGPRGFPGTNGTNCTSTCVNGTNGTNGTNGINGTNGTNGINGTNGTNGTNGINGTNGTSATIAVGTVTTLSPGSDATVTNVGTSSAAIFDFGIPQGDTGFLGDSFFYIWDENQQISSGALSQTPVTFEGPFASNGFTQTSLENFTANAGSGGRYECSYQMPVLFASGSAQSFFAWITVNQTIVDPMSATAILTTNPTPAITDLGQTFQTIIADYDVITLFWASSTGNSEIFPQTGQVSWGWGFKTGARFGCTQVGPTPIT